MRVLLATIISLCPLTALTVDGSNPYYRQSYYPSYPVYYPPAQVYNNTYNNYIPYAVPLYSAGYVQPTAVISGSVAYSQSITTTATAGAQTTVQSVLGAEASLQQSQRTEQFMEAIIRIAEQMGPAKAANVELPHVSLLMANCASCHSGDTARAKFQIFDGNGKYVLHPEDIGKVLFRLSTNKTDPNTKRPLRMPPNGRLAQDVHDQIVEGLVTQPAEQTKVEPAANPKKEEGF